MWDTIGFVGSGVTLGAFLGAVAAWIYRQKILQKSTLIRLAPESERTKLVLAALEFFNVDAANLPELQQYELALQQIRARARRSAISAVLVALLALLAAAVTIYAIRQDSLKAQIDADVSKEQLRAERLDEIVRELEQELSDKHIRLEGKDEKIAALVGYITDPPPISRRARYLANLIREDDPPYARALKAIAERRFDDARELLQEDRKRLKREAERNYRATGDAYYHEHRFKEALVWYERTLKIDSTDMSVRLSVAACLFRLNDLDAARLALDDLVRDFDEKKSVLEHFEILGAALNNRAGVNMRMLLWTEAIDDCDRALSIYNRVSEHVDEEYLTPRIATTLNNRGSINARRGELDRAIADYKGAIDLLDAHVDDEERSDLSADLAMTRANRALAMSGKGNHREAITEYNVAISVYTELVEQKGHHELSNEFARTLQYRGESHYQLGNLATAINDVDKAVTLRRRLVEQLDHAELAARLAKSVTIRSDILLEQRNFPAAIEGYNEAVTICTEVVIEKRQIEFASELVSAMINRGIAFGKQRKFADGIKDFDEAIALCTHFIERHDRSDLYEELTAGLQNRGHARLLTSRFIDAIEDFDRAIEIRRRLLKQWRPEHASGLARSLTSRGYGHLALEDYLTAFDDLDEAVSIRKGLVDGGRIDFLKDLASTLRYRAYVLEKQGKQSDSVLDYEQAIELYTIAFEKHGRKEVKAELTRLLNQQAWLRASSSDKPLRDGAKAVKYSTRSCELTDWKDFRLLDTLAAAYAEDGDFAAAQKWQKKALDLAPQTEQAELRSRFDLYRARKPYHETPDEQS